MQLLKKAERDYSLKNKMVESSEYYAYQKIILEKMTGNVVISQVYALMYVVISKAKIRAFIEN